uniref:Protein kinase domain-containing protein n=1 Tax=Neogobius melanostomus TaxID=47308 RepID=A0A8C6T4X5_9GOBI
MKSKQFLSELEAHGYKVCKVLNRGRSGNVYECLMGKWKQSVAIKIPHMDHNNSGEAGILRHLMKWSMNESNIVTCIGEFTHLDSEILVFEKLDVNLEKYICQSHCKPMPLTHIRDVVKQMGSALSALSITEIIHTDIKPSNIMTVKPNQKSFQIKLIDFGSALSTSDAKQGSTLGTIGFMSPEIMLGLPFTQATDVWSLGCVVAYLMLGYPLFNTQSEYKAFKGIHQIIGQPSDELLKKGLYTSKYYKEYNNKWSPVEARMDFERLTSLDDLKPMRAGLFNKLEPIQREQCVELLKKMLQINPENRITPEEIKKHPFVTGHYQRKSSWKRFIPFKKNNKVSPLQPENQLPQRTLNTLPSEKVFKIPRVSETTTKTVNPFSRRNKIFPLNEGQKTYGMLNVEKKRGPHSSGGLNNPGSNMAPTSFNSQPSKKPRVIRVPPASGPTHRTLISRCPNFYDYVSALAFIRSLFFPSLNQSVCGVDQPRWQCGWYPSIRRPHPVQK